MFLDSWAPLCYPLNKKIDWVTHNFLKCSHSAIQLSSRSCFQRGLALRQIYQARGNVNSFVSFPTTCSVLTQVQAVQKIPAQKRLNWNIIFIPWSLDKQQMFINRKQEEFIGTHCIDHNIKQALNRWLHKKTGKNANKVKKKHMFSMCFFYLLVRTINNKHKTHNSKNKTLFPSLWT